MPLIKKDKEPAASAIVKREPTLPSADANVPEFMRNSGRQRGLENATREDFVIPRLAVCQNMSPQRARNNKPEAIPDLEEGMFFNTLTKEIYGERPLLVTPISFFRNRWKFDDKGNVECFSPDSYTQGKLHPEGCRTCPHSQFVDGEAPDCTLFMNYPLYIQHSVDNPERPPEFAMVSLKGANLRAAKEWNTLMGQRRHDIFGGLYVIEPVQEQNDLGTYYVIKVRNAGVIKDEALFKAMEAQYEVVAQQDLASRQDLVDRDTAVAPEPEM